MKVLITCGRLTNGGVQRSLIEFLRLIQGEIEQGTLVLPSPKGSLIEEVPSSFNIQTLPARLQVIEGTALSRRGLRPALSHPVRSLRAGISAAATPGASLRNIAQLFREKLLEIAAKEFEVLRLDFVPDVIVQYAGGQGIWDALIVHMFPDVPKVVWVHGDIERFGSGSRRQRSLLASYDRAVTVSAHGEKQLLKAVPELLGKTQVVENHLDLRTIGDLSCDAVEDVEFKVPTICSVTRLTRGKALDVAVGAALLLKKRGIDFQWLLIGDGAEHVSLARSIEELGLEEEVRMLGWRSNPYPYISRSTVFAHTSRSEGKSVAIAEALALGKPVVVTHYPSVGDQITNGRTGIVVDISPAALADGLERVLTDPVLKDQLSSNARLLDVSGTTTSELMELLSAVRGL